MGAKDIGLLEYDKIKAHCLCLQWKMLRNAVVQIEEIILGTLPGLAI